MNTHYFPLKTKPHSEVMKSSRGRLPHWEIQNALYFVTFSLSDSIPSELLNRVILRCKEKINNDPIDSAISNQDKKKKYRRLLFMNIEKMLDKGFGNPLLSLPRNADTVSDALRYFDGSRYELHCFCVMPNHVHVLFQVLGQNRVANIVKSWKGYTAYKINQDTGSSGRIWMREYFDRIIRDEAAYLKIINYIMGNPAKAGLKEWKYVWCSSGLMAAVLSGSGK